MSSSIKRIAITGAAGQIAYSILFNIARGELLGKQQPIALHLLDLPEAKEALKGVAMELEDCACPLLKEIHMGSDPYEIFEGVNFAFLIGARPRGPGMERKDLLSVNAKIFTEQGKALNAKADKDLLTLVVGNPCNTNCLITLKQANRFSPDRFYAMTRLDQNRAVAMLAKKAEVDLELIHKMTIWGNHSSTQVPDFLNARIGEKAVLDVIKDHSWLEKEFVEKVQKRGAEVIAARGKSSAASAARAALDAMSSLIFPTPERTHFSAARLSDGNSYGIKEGIVFSFPFRTSKEGKIEMVPDLEWNPFLKEKISITEKELLEERSLIADLLK